MVKCYYVVVTKCTNRLTQVVQVLPFLALVTLPCPRDARPKKWWREVPEGGHLDVLKWVDKEAMQGQATWSHAAHFPRLNRATERTCLSQKER